MAKVKGSQLSQLKSALSEAGLSRRSQTKTSGKRRKRSVAVTSSETAKGRAAKKLREIHERLNPFEVKITKLKHDVGGRKLKGVTGRPGLSKHAGIEQRKRTLLVEYNQRNHAGGIVDRRFGENNPTMTPEERMLERFTRERQRASKGLAFNLEDEEDLTHYGQSLSAMDDFDDTGLGLDDMDEDNGQIDKETVRRTHFGGFEDDDENGDGDEPARKKSKTEVMAEIISKSKEHKYQRQSEKEEDESARVHLDKEFDSIRGFLFDSSGPSGTGSNTIPLGRGRIAPTIQTCAVDQDDQGYDQVVRELAFEKRARPKDRTKTEEELALEEKEALEKAERARLRRMMGDEDDTEDDEDGRKRRKRKGDWGGDDLEDDLKDNEVPGRLGIGLGSEEEQEGVGDETDGGSDDESPAESSEEEHASSDSDDNSATNSLEGEIHGSLPLTSSGRAVRIGRKIAKIQELPFTFPCPASHDEFLSIVEDIDDADIPTVVQRIRSLYHPSLSGDNPGKLQTFIEVLVDHILHVASPPTPSFFLVEALVPHIYALTQKYPVASAQVFVAKLSLMQKNFIRGLSVGASASDSKTWPGLAELALLRVLGIVWSTSDMNHAVVSPARILMGAYLGLGRVRCVADLASGLFLCTIFLQFEDLSKRLVPEVINFLINLVLHIAPHPFMTPESVPGSFPMPDFRNDAIATLKVHDKEAKDIETARPDLIAILCEQDAGPAQYRLNLLAAALQLLGDFAEIYKGLEGFIELYASVLEILNNLALTGFPTGLQHRRSKVEDAVSRLLKFAKQSRRPLSLQMHKPIPIPSYVPKFTTTSSNFLRQQDPDHERTERAKLRNQVKQERKGAIRELRKDSRFLAVVQQKREMEEAQAYQDKMKRVFGSIEGERAEQKAVEREKARAKKRAGRK